MATEKATYRATDLRAWDGSGSEMVRGNVTNAETGTWTPAEFGGWWVRDGYLQIRASQQREHVDFEGRDYPSNDDEPAVECLTWGSGESPNEFIEQDSDVGYQGEEAVFLQVGSDSDGTAFTFTELRSLDEQLFMGEDWPDDDNWDPIFNGLILEDDPAVDDKVFVGESKILLQEIWGGSTDEGAGILSTQANTWTLDFNGERVIDGSQLDMSNPHEDFIQGTLPMLFTETPAEAGIIVLDAPYGPEAMDGVTLVMQFPGEAACADTGVGAGVDKVHRTTYHPSVNWTWWVHMVIMRKIRDIEPEPIRYRGDEAEVIARTLPPETPLTGPNRQHSARRARDAR